MSHPLFVTAMSFRSCLMSKGTWFPHLLQEDRLLNYRDNLPDTENQSGAVAQTESILIYTRQGGHSDGRVMRSHYSVVSRNSSSKGIKFRKFLPPHNWSFSWNNKNTHLQTIESKTPSKDYFTSFILVDPWDLLSKTDTQTWLIKKHVFAADMIRFWKLSMLWSKANSSARWRMDKTSGCSFWPTKAVWRLWCLVSASARKRTANARDAVLPL